MYRYKYQIGIMTRKGYQQYLERQLPKLFRERKIRGIDITQGGDDQSRLHSVFHPLLYLRPRVNKKWRRVYKLCWSEMAAHNTEGPDSPYARYPLKRGIPAVVPVYFLVAIKVL
jgi:tRNA(Ile)-lysidine synthase TilS/MesJ